MREKRVPWNSLTNKVTYFIPVFYLASKDKTVQTFTSILWSPSGIIRRFPFYAALWCVSFPLPLLPTVLGEGDPFKMELLVGLMRRNSPAFLSCQLTKMLPQNCLALELSVWIPSDWPFTLGTRNFDFGLASSSALSSCWSDVSCEAKIAALTVSFKVLVVIFKCSMLKDWFRRLSTWLSYCFFCLSNLWGKNYKFQYRLHQQ